MHSYPGSKWWAFDFHNHTPASSDYDASERAILTPRDWLLSYMRGGADCVAVTDHNCGDWIDRLQQGLQGISQEQPLPLEYRPLHLFPGVELTTAEGLHILAIYGPAEGAAKVYGLLALAKCNTHLNNAERICAEGAAAICDHIHNTGGLAILDHAEEVNGIFEGSVGVGGHFLAKRGAREIAQIISKCDGVEVHNLNHPALQHFANYASKHALVDGSDAHKTTNAGKRMVWLKMATPCIEGLNLALLNRSSSITRHKAHTSAPALRISSVAIEQLLLRRKRLDVSLSPWFNSIIGGRGSGKSTILESLRLVMSRVGEVQDLGENSDVRRAFLRFREVGGARGSAGMVRNDSVISATVEKHDAATNGVERYQFRWTPTTFKVERWDDGGNWTDTGLNAEQAAKLFPVKVFSQKQVFELAERPSALLTYIDSSSEVDYSSWQDKYENLRRTLRELRAKERALNQAIAKKPQLETEFKESARKATAYQQSSVAVQMKVFSENQQARHTVGIFVNAVMAPINALNAVIKQGDPYHGIKIGMLSLEKPDPAPVKQAADTLINELQSHYEHVVRAIEDLNQCVLLFQSKPEVSSFRSELDAGMNEYRQEVERLKAQGVGTAGEAEAALKRKQELESALTQIVAQEQQLNGVQNALRKAYVQLKRHRRELTRRRCEFVDKVLVGNGRLRITIHEQADVAQSVPEFRSVLRLQDGTFVDDIYSVDSAADAPTGLLGKLVINESAKLTHKRVTSLKLGILRRDREILGWPLHGKLVTAIGRLTTDDEDALLEWFPHDRVVVQFRRGDAGGFQSLERASAGQKTSAILSFLLAHGDEPLLLDQPEDDLDNALISELVVDQIRTHKPRRQIVVVTHNPNIVVNGDAELVLPMEFESGQIHIKEPGGLQERAVRQRICDVMEGGREAFLQRYKRILKDLDV